ncbi:hypothetical protein [Streptococcus ruminantium]|uniref:hypothetical protein n=1 Tax=Streptococcus ruminantium TaxID=1917441 RepID=UPI0012DD878B|nr:hypothetical protein [Streptococcus ruminantium]
MGNNQLYHQTGQIFSIGSFIIAPIGQTGSVVKGLAQFGGGALGAWGGGELGYHGAKLLGTSDSQANAAKFLTSMAGASAGSSLAGKFSLNKPIKNLKRPELMEELANSGYKYDADSVILVNKNTDGKLLWLEKGTTKAGHEHIVLRHGDDFSNLGINDIPSFIDDALGIQPIQTGIGAKGPFSKYEIGGRNYILAYGDNGFIVSFYPSK